MSLHVWRTIHIHKDFWFWGKHTTSSLIHLWLIFGIWVMQTIKDMVHVLQQENKAILYPHVIQNYWDYYQELIESHWNGWILWILQYERSQGHWRLWHIRNFYGPHVSHQLPTIFHRMQEILKGDDENKDSLFKYKVAIVPRKISSKRTKQPV